MSKKEPDAKEFLKLVREKSKELKLDEEKLNRELIMTKKDEIIEEIRKIYDPELPVNIYELGLIYDIKVKDEKFAIIKMTLTTPNCPVAESLPKEVKEGAMQVEGIEDVDLELVWDPPWNKDMMSEAAKLELNL
jgi:FeS assembly SUF system protein